MMEYEKRTRNSLSTRSRRQHHNVLQGGRPREPDLRASAFFRENYYLEPLPRSQEFTKKQNSNFPNGSAVRSICFGAWLFSHTKAPGSASRRANKMAAEAEVGVKLNGRLNWARESTGLENNPNRRRNGLKDEINGGWTPAERSWSGRWEWEQNRSGGFHSSSDRPHNSPCNRWLTIETPASKMSLMLFKWRHLTSLLPQSGLPLFRSWLRLNTYLMKYENISRKWNLISNRYKTKSRFKNYGTVRYQTFSRNNWAQTEFLKGNQKIYRRRPPLIREEAVVGAARRGFQQHPRRWRDLDHKGAQCIPPGRLTLRMHTFYRWHWEWSGEGQMLAGGGANASGCRLIYWWL
jgi:hypothetical protein